MKKILLRSFTIFLLIIPFFVSAQYNVRTWLNGLHAQINFYEDSAFESYISFSDLVSRTCGIISDSSGNLLFFSNGFRVYNKNFSIMPNGNNLNIGDYISYGYNTLLVPDGAVIIPVPDDNNKFYLFHVDLNFHHIQGQDWLYPDHIFYSIIDMTLSGGLGNVVAGEKDIPIIDDTLTCFGMQAVKHANGRDWWLLSHEYGSNRYYEFLIDPYGIHGPYSISTGIKFELNNARVASPMKFSDDGDKFLQLSWDSNQVAIYDFDRCTGELQNYQPFAISDSNEWTSGASFSPNGRYVYVSSNYYGISQLLQFDLEAPDISSSRIVVGEDDGIADPFQNTFYSHQLASDGKIYVISYNGNSSLNIINEPDSPGVACNFVIRGMDWDNGSYWFGGVPNIPNYNLGPLYGSGCDTLSGIQTLTSNLQFTLAPNPVSSYINIVYSAEHNATLTITNAYGISVKQLTLYPYFKNRIVYVDDLAEGIYLVTLREGGRVSSRKMILLR